MVVHYILLLRRNQEVEVLKEENIALRGEVSQVHELNNRLREYETYVNKIDEILGVSEGGDKGQELSEIKGTALTTKSADQVPAASGGDHALFVPLGDNDVPSEWPLTRRGFITRGYLEDSSFHPGIDIAVPVNTPVRATASGIVVDLGWDSVFGNFVEIRHGDVYMTKYGHNTRLIVHKGQWVRKGEIIAFSGNTGKSTGPHLHYEVWRKGVAVDPQPYMLGYGHMSKSDG